MIDAVSLAGSRFRPNEDAFGRAWHRAWVIDGATSLGDPYVSGSSDAAWFADRASYAFARRAHILDTREFMQSVADDLAQIFEAERARPPHERWEVPCASFVMMTALPNGDCEIAWLGDCRAIVASEDVAHAFGATPVSEEKEAQHAAKFAGDDSAEHFRSPEALAALRAGRSCYNQPDGPWILAPDRDFAAHVKIETVTIKRPAHALLMTDGFAALELRYLDMAEPTFIPAALENGLARLAARLRRIEEDMDPTCSHFPRWKRSDDATAMLLSLT